MNTITDFLGEEIISEYKSIFPVLRLICFSMDSGGKAELSIPKPDKKIILRVMKYYFRKCFFHHHYSDSIYLSEKMLCLDRFELMIQKLYSSESIIGGALYGNTGLKKPAKGSIEDIRRNIRTVYWGNSIATHALSDVCCELYDIFNDLRSDGKNCSDAMEELKPLLNRLSILTCKRISIVKEKLVKAKVKLFVTVHQFNLFDMLIIMACHELGIKTQELSHHSNANYPIRFFKDMAIKSSINGIDTCFEDNCILYMAVDESTQWSEADVEFCTKYFPKKNIWNNPVQYRCVGCPEVTESIIEQKQTKYHRENVITLFVPIFSTYVGFNNGIAEAKNQKLVVDCRKPLMKGVEELAKREGMKVYLRYHPTEPQEVINAENNTLEKGIFEVMSSSREDFYKCLFESRLVIGNYSSTILVALACGCKAWCIADNESDFDLCGLNIELVKENELAKQKISDYLDKSNVECIQIERLING